MKGTFVFQDTEYAVDFDLGIDLSIPLSDQEPQVNCYHADLVRFETYRVGSFVGSVQEGGSVNYQKLTITPHGNGTHTECYGHISGEGLTIASALKIHHFFALLITLSPDQVEGDDVVLYNSFLEKTEGKTIPEAVIIRSAPNEESKKIRQYSGTNPPYLDHRICEKLNELGIKHLLTDLPSVDKEVDGGELKSHRAFWNEGGEIREEATITELIYVPDSVADGYYLLNLQTLNLEMDASPSKPIIYPLEVVRKI